jgi:hypothetical protein
MALLSQTRLRLAAIVAASMIAGGAMTGAALAEQGHMLNAQHALEIARSQLSMAEADKAGYRVQAMGYVNDALTAVNAGLAAGAR